MPQLKRVRNNKRVSNSKSDTPRVKILHHWKKAREHRQIWINFRWASWGQGLVVSAGLGRLPWDLFPHTLLLSTKHEARKLLLAAWKHSQSGEGKLFGLGGSTEGLFLQWKHRKCQKMDLSSQTFWVHSRTPYSLDNGSSLVFGSFFFSTALCRQLPWRQVFK